MKYISYNDINVCKLKYRKTNIYQIAFALIDEITISK